MGLRADARKGFFSSDQNKLAIEGRSMVGDIYG
jgi:hypothetical protein